MTHASTQEHVGERFRLAAHATGFGVWEWLPGDNQVLWDEKLHEIYELDPAGGLDKTDYFYGIVHPDDKASIDKQMSDLLKSPEDHKYFEQVCRIVVPSGKTKIIRTYGEVFSENGKVLSIVGISRDISEHENLKANLQISQDQLNMICENLNDMIVLHRYDAGKDDFEMSFVNKAFAQAQPMLGVSLKKEELENLYLTDYLSDVLKFPAELVEIRMRRLKGVLQYGRAERFIEESEHLGERAMVLESVIKPIKRSNGRQFVLWVSRDITPLVKARRKMASTTTKYKLLAEQIQSVIFCLDEEGNPIEVSPKISGFLGYTADEIVLGGKDLWLDIVEDKKLFEKSLNALFQRRVPLNAESHFIHKDGSRVTLRVKAETMRDELDTFQAFGTLSRI